MFTLFKKLASLSPLYKYRIKGTSMLPTFSDGTVILINRVAYYFTKPQINDVVAIYDPRDRKVLIKRISKNKNNQYFVQGDNKRFSTDSRVFGMIERKDIIGKVWL